MSLFGTMDEVERETFLRNTVTVEKCGERETLTTDLFGVTRDSDGNRWNNNGDGTWSQSPF